MRSEGTQSLFSSFPSPAAATPVLATAVSAIGSLSSHLFPAPSAMVAPRGSWAKTKVPADTLEEWDATGAIPEASASAWRTTTGDEQPQTRVGEFMMFTSFLGRGFVLPSSEFFQRFLAFYRIQVHDLTPNSILHLSCFVTLCEAFLGCSAYFPLWLQLFHGKMGNQKALLPCSGLNFQVHGGLQYPDLHLPKKVNQWRTGNF